MRKISLIGFVMLIVSIPTFAGGLLTNTNQHAAFLRMLSRGATFEIDGALSAVRCRGLRIFCRFGFFAKRWFPYGIEYSECLSDEKY